MKNKLNPYYILLFIAFLLFENVFYFIPLSEIKILGVFLDDIFLIIYVFLMLIIIFKEKIRLSKTYVLFFVLTIIGIVLSSLNGMSFFSQSFFEGIRLFRSYLGILITYFALAPLLKKKKITTKGIVNLIFIFGLLESVLYIIQSILYPNLVFLTAVKFSTDNKINSSLFSRAYFDSCAIDVMIIMSVLRFFQSGKLKYILSLILGFIYLIFVSQGRLELFAIVVACFVVAYLELRASKKNSLKLYSLIFTAFFAIVLFLSSENTRTLISDFISGNDTMTIRYSARELYFNGLKSSWKYFLFGCGYPNTSNITAAELSGYSTNHFLVADNGIFGYFYITGALGVVTAIILLISMLKCSGSGLGAQARWIYGLVAFFLVSSTNLAFWFFKSDWILMIAICMAITEQYKQHKYKFKSERNNEKVFRKGRLSCNIY